MTDMFRIDELPLPMVPMSIPATPSASQIISLFDDDETRWEAVRNRNVNADGFFVYGVKTTKIYCRPICKARLARRANVTFYSNNLEARDAGFRACKRCQPEMAGFMPEEVAVRKIKAFVSSGGGEDDEGADGLMSLGQMARRTGLSKWHFHRVFKKCVGMTPVEYVRMKRNCRNLDPVGERSDSSSATPGTLSASPGMDADGNWFGGIEVADFDFSTVNTVVDPTLEIGGEFEGSTRNGEDDMVWADLLEWPEDDFLAPP